MAIIPSAKYPAQTDTDADYPQGKARNAGSYQDGTGTPLERDWVNDLWGFKQALLAAAAITPSGDPDKLGASQYLDAILSLASLKFGVYYFNQVAAVDDGDRFPLVEVVEHGGFTLVLDDTTVQGPSIGNYVAFMAGTFKSPSVVNPTNLTLEIVASGSGGPSGVISTRRSNAAGDYVPMSFITYSNRSVAMQPDGGDLSGFGHLFILKLT